MNIILDMVYIPSKRKKPMIQSDQRFEHREARRHSDFISEVMHHSIHRPGCSAAWGFLAYGIIWKHMSELQDQLDRGEITPDQYDDAWNAEMEENERLHPGIHHRGNRHLPGK
jgi:hypothetical protein